MTRILYLLFLSILLPVLARRRKDGNPLSRGIVVMNRSGVKLDFYWVHPTTGELAGSNTDGGIVHGAESSINSYVGHTFEVQELPRKKTGTCVASSCMVTRFTVSPNEDQIYIIGENFVVKPEDHKTRARDKAQESLKECQSQVENSKLSPDEQLDKLAKCMEESLAASMRQTNEEIQFQSNLRKQMGHAWADYACKDAKNVTTTMAIANETWAYRDSSRGRGMTRHPLNTLFESDYNRIQRVQRFLTFEDCEALEEAAKPDAGSLVVPLSARKQTAAIDRIVKKVEKFVTDTTQMTATLRKDPMFDVRIISDSMTQSKDCSVGADGSTTCAATEMVSPERIEVSNTNTVVTILLMCKAPSEGGQILFPKTGTVLIPSDFVGSAILLMHETDGEREEDPFLDEYVICPVTKGKFLAFSEDLAK